MKLAKSLGIAVLLEILIPGAGAMYLERVKTGLVWLIGSLIVYFILGYLILDQYFASGYDPYVINGNAVLFSVIANIVWLCIRLPQLNRFAQEYNARLGTP